MVLKDKKTKITFHSGVLTIGGTVIEVSYGNARIFFDFGTEYKPELKLENENLDILLEHKLVPELDQVYDARLSENSNLSSDKEYADTAVFLSHVHLDHTRMVNYLDSSIPMYALKETKILLDSLNASGDFILPGFDEDTLTRDIIACENGDVISVGEINVELLRVDHDAYGACGLIITTPDLTIAYTGDLRLHGFDVEDTMHYIKEAKNADVLIIEGVTVSFDDDEEEPSVESIPVESEQELVNELVTLINENPKKQITFNAYPANVKRLYEIHKQSPRDVVFAASFAYILKACLDVNVLYYQDNDFDYKLNPDNEISYDKLLDDTSDYLWQAVGNYEKLKEGGLYVHSNAVPLGPFDPSYEPFVEALENNEIQMVKLSCTGHAKPKDLDKIIDLVQADLLIPIHSLRPERLENPHGDRHLPVRGETI